MAKPIESLEPQLIIEDRVIHEAQGCYVIAEVGHNHQGSLEKAKALILAAKVCGADAVKFQKRNNPTLYTRAMYESPYDHEHSFGPTYGAHREALEFGREAYQELQHYAREVGITMFATAFDQASVEVLASLNMPAYKIASGDVTNIPLLKQVARLGKPVLVSTGGATMDDVQRVYDTVIPLNLQLCLLQCTASYPVEPEDMHLQVITTYRQRFPDIIVGLSDHQNGIAMSLIAFVLGARVIEKHFTLNRAWKGPDQAFSLEPSGLHKLVRDLHRAHMAMGDGIKRVLPCESRAIFKMGKKLVAARDLPEGTVLGPEDIAIKSPSDGLPPYALDQIIGRATCRVLKADESILMADVTK